MIGLDLIAKNQLIKSIEQSETNNLKAKLQKLQLNLTNNQQEQEIKQKRQKLRIQNLYQLEVSQIMKVQPMSQGQNQHVLYTGDGKDHRTLCQNPDKFPFSAIGQLPVTFGLNNGYGTAFLIDANFALTAAHNVYNRQQKTAIKNSNLIMRINDYQGKSYKVICIYFPKQYKQKLILEEAQQFDFALLILQNNEQMQKKRVFTIRYEDINEKDLIQIYGYPNDLCIEKYNEDRRKFYRGQIQQIPRQKSLFGCNNIILGLSDRTITHNVDTNVGQSGSPIMKWNSEKQTYEAVGIHTRGFNTKNQGIRLTLQVFSRINEWIKGFSRGQQSQQRVMLIQQEDLQIFLKKKVRITPDKTTKAWKHKNYREGNANKNVCIYQGIFLQMFLDPFSLQWLCSSDWRDNEFAFTIKVHKVSKIKRWILFGRYISLIAIGVMDSNYKGKEWDETRNHYVILFIGGQIILTPNQEQTKQKRVNCPCQPLLSLPCLIECHVNRQFNKITWNYNGKLQAESKMPISWQDGRKLCAIVKLFYPGNSLEFI